MERILEDSQFGMELLLTVANLIIFSCDTIYLALKLEHLDLAMMGQFLGSVWEPALVMFTPHNFKSISQIYSSRLKLVGRTVQCVYSPDGSTYIVINSSTITISGMIIAMYTTLVVNHVSNRPNS